MAVQTVEIGGEDFVFDVTQKKVNKFLNNASGDDKITPTVNLLLDTVEKTQFNDLKAVLLDDENTPKGALVLQIAGLLITDFTSDVEVTLKK